MRPRVLDLFCGAGGAGHGYALAGFDVVGVDIRPQPRYPYSFIQCDWEEALRLLPGLWEREGVPYVIHASPPCQRYSRLTAKWGRSDEHPDLIEPVQMAVRDVCEDGRPYVIENVPGAPLDDALTLCGSMFGLGAGGYQLRRHRLFESNVWLSAPQPCAHASPTLPVYGHTGRSSRRDGLSWPTVDVRRAGMGTPWMRNSEMAEAIPPAYTNWIGCQLLRAMQS